MRAFAKSLAVSHSALSLVMSGRRPVSRNLMNRLADNMGMSLEQKTEFALTIESQRGSVPKFRKIDLDLFEVISDWYHFGILSLLDLPNAKFDAKWIAARLSISPIQARAAMSRLERLGLIAEQDGRMKQTGAPIKLENSLSTAATRKYHEQLLNKAQEVLVNEPMEVRDFSSMTFAMDESLVPLARDRIRNFRRKLMAELESKGSPDRVYNLTVQIYPASTKSHVAKDRNEICH